MHNNNLAIHRRAFLTGSSLGLGTLALSGLLGRSLTTTTAAAAPTSPNPGSSGALPAMQYAPTAKRVIFLCMAGGPSHLELFDEKPALAKLDGQPMPASYTQGQPIAQLQGQELVCWGPRAKFRSHGNSGQRISDFLPNIANHADDLCIIRSMVTEQINHDPAHTFMNTGTSISGRPSMGAWITYGLGSEADDLPGFVVMTSRSGRSPQPVSSRQWHSGFLPSKYQGVPFHSNGEPVHYVTNPAGVDRRRQQDVVNTVGALNRLYNARADDPEIVARISQYELAFRMQASVPTLTDISDEPRHVLNAYGVERADGSFAFNCLLARRLAERGVRFVQLYHRGWDHHDNLDGFMKTSCRSVDKPTAALLSDLKERGMLEDTLVVWGGEFGRTPMAQKKSSGASLGRDHHIKGFSMMLAGGGVKGGVTYGATDELGYHAVEDKMHVHDLHATMLYLLGVDHKTLTYRYQGRDFRLTDVAGEVVRGVVA